MTNNAKTAAAIGSRKRPLRPLPPPKSKEKGELLFRVRRRFRHPVGILPGRRLLLFPVIGFHPRKRRRRRRRRFRRQPLPFEQRIGREEYRELRTVGSPVV